MLLRTLQLYSICATLEDLITDEITFLGKSILVLLATRVTISSFSMVLVHRTCFLSNSILLWYGSLNRVMANSDNDNHGKFKILTHERTSRLQQPSILYIWRLGWLSAIAINFSESNCSHILKLRVSRACKWASQLRTLVATTSLIFIQCSKYNSFKCNRLTTKNAFMWKFVDKSKITRFEQFPKVRATLRLVSHRRKSFLNFTVPLKYAFKTMPRVERRMPCIL